MLVNNYYQYIWVYWRRAYCKIVFKVGDHVEQEEFIRRMVELRQRKGVSARDMSLSIGQSPNYINNIENGLSFPSMSTFFYICEYFGITAEEFFNIKMNDPTRIHDLVDGASCLDDEALDHLIAVTRAMGKHTK